MKKYIFPPYKLESCHLKWFSCLKFLEIRSVLEKVLVPLPWNSILQSNQMKGNLSRRLGWMTDAYQIFRHLLKCCSSSDHLVETFREANARFFLLCSGNHSQMQFKTSFCDHWLIKIWKNKKTKQSKTTKHNTTNKKIVNILEKYFVNFWAHKKYVA